MTTRKKIGLAAAGALTVALSLVLLPQVRLAPEVALADPPLGPTLQVKQAGTLVSPNAKVENFVDCTVSNSGTTASITCAGAGGGITGSGTANTIPKFTSASTVGNSSVTDNGTTVTMSEPVTLANSTTALTTGNYASHLNSAITATGGVDVANVISSTNTLSSADKLVSFQNPIGAEKMAVTGAGDVSLSASGSIGYLAVSNFTTYRASSIDMTIGGNTAIALDNTSLKSSTDGGYQLGDNTHRWAGVYSATAGPDTNSQHTIPDVAASTYVLASTIASSLAGSGAPAGSWTAAFVGAATTNTNFSGAMSWKTNTPTFSRVTCSSTVAGNTGSTNMTVQIYDVTASASVCTCTLGACNTAALIPLACNCAGTVTAADNYTVRLTSVGDCATPPTGVYCNVEVVM